MNYKVIKNFRGSPDGCRVLNFVKDDMLVENQDFPMSLIKVALAEGWIAPALATKKKVVKKKTVKKKVTK